MVSDPDKGYHSTRKKGRSPVLPKTTVLVSQTVRPVTSTHKCQAKSNMSSLDSDLVPVNLD